MNQEPRTIKGLFVGITTLDLIYLTPQFPHQNQKIVASDYTISAGGPATNAAVTFAHLGNPAELLTVLGKHPLSHLIREDLETHQVKIIDLAPDKTDPPVVSSVITTQGIGDRAVVSLNALKSQASVFRIPTDILQDIAIILIDGHQMAVSQAITKQAKSQGIPIVVDGGSWKPGLEELLPFVDYAICSANFYPPGCQTQDDIFAFLTDAGIAHIAITQGENPLIYLSKGQRGEVEIPIIQAVDTLGSGDIFHGAFTYYILKNNFINSLSAAVKVASYACQSFGTRQWMKS